MEQKPNNNKEFSISFDNLVLCNERTPRVHVHVLAEVSDGCLKISGQDFGEAPMEAFGDSEYEYFYTFDRVNTERLFSLLAPEGQDVRTILKKRFSGMHGDADLIDFCKDNGITYDFFSC
jgi:hypothetical protein